MYKIGSWHSPLMPLVAINRWERNGCDPGVLLARTTLRCGKRVGNEGGFLELSEFDMALSAVRVNEEIVKGPDGYQGSVILVRRYMRKI